MSPHVITGVLSNGWGGRRERFRGMAAWEELSPLLLALKIEGARSQGIQAASRSYNKGQEMGSSLEGPEGIQPSWHFVAHGDPVQTSDFQCVPPISLGSFVTAAKHSSQSSLEATILFLSFPFLFLFFRKISPLGFLRCLAKQQHRRHHWLFADGHCTSWASQVVQW